MPYKITVKKGHINHNGKTYHEGASFTSSVDLAKKDKSVTSEEIIVEIKHVKNVATKKSAKEA